MGRRKGQKRFGYRKLSPTYRNRLAKKGISQTAWEMGAQLSTARGHKLEGYVRQPKSLQDLTQKAVRTELTPKQIIEMEHQLRRPSWIPNRMRTENAAALAQLPDPKSWKHVYVTPSADGPWRLTVYRKRSKYPLIIEIPAGGGGEGEAPREIIDLLQDLKFQYNSESLERSRNRNQEDHEIFYAVTGTDEIAPNG